MSSSPETHVICYAFLKKTNRPFLSLIRWEKSHASFLQYTQISQPLLVGYSHTPFSLTPTWLTWTPLPFCFPLLILNLSLLPSFISPKLFISSPLLFPDSRKVLLKPLQLINSVWVNESEGEKIGGASMREGAVVTLCFSRWSSLSGTRTSWLKILPWLPFYAPYNLSLDLKAKLHLYGNI